MVFGFIGGISLLFRLNLLVTVGASGEPINRLIAFCPVARNPTIAFLMGVYTKFTYVRGPALLSRRPCLVGNGFVHLDVLARAIGRRWATCTQPDLFFRSEHCVIVMTLPARAPNRGWIRKYIVGPTLVLLILLGVALVVGGVVLLYVVYQIFTGPGGRLYM